ncbi:hypothetical protein Hanom_Chr08g00690381 [Helianthus anomalus]
MSSVPHLSKVEPAARGSSSQQRRAKPQLLIHQIKVQEIILHLKRPNHYRIRHFRTTIHKR